MLPHPWIIFKIQKYYQKKPQIGGNYSRNNLLNVKDGTCVINVQYNSVEIHWIDLYVNGDNATYFDDYGVEIFQNKFKKFIDDRNITENIFRIQVND